MRRSYAASARPATRILAQVFDLPGATALGGLNQLAAFAHRLGIDRKLADRFRAVKAEWHRWRLDRVLRIFLDAHFAGVERLYHFEDLETEPLLCAQHGVERLPDVKTLYRDLRRFEDPALFARLRQVLDAVVSEALAGQDRVVLEIDSTVETLHGSQEGAAFGYNPHKPGRPSYHPLLARDRISDLVVHHTLRPGNAGPATGINAFLHQTLDRLPPGPKGREVLARLDAGFEYEEALRVLERRGVGYVMKMRATSQVAGHACSLPPQAWRWVPGENETQVASFRWQRPKAWDQPRRVVVRRVRHAGDVQGHLWDECGWSYSLFVTDRDWAPEDVARFYDKPADAERTICEAKHDVQIDHVPSASFGANAADLALKILARNVLVLYRDRGLKLLRRERIMTLRRRYLCVAGRLVAHAGKRLLRLTADSPLAHRPLAVRRV